jgi:aromatic-L-amino-acid decarboxylase
MLELPAERMRELGYRVVDRLVEHSATLPAKRVACRTDRSELEKLLREPVPVDSSDAADVLALLDRAVFANMTHVDHPRFFAFVPGPSNFVGVLADALAAGHNVFAGTWLAASGPAEVELVTLDWLRQLCGLPDSAGGLFTSGGTMANLTGLAVARDDRLGGVSDPHAVVYCSDQTHYCVARALKVLGFGPEQVRHVTTDAPYRLDIQAVADAVARDRAAGRRPFAVVANAGTTNTGAVDPLEELASFCRSQALWLHVDGAYGAAAVVCDEGKQLLRGLEQADSLVIDPHKWLFQPFDIGCLLLRDGSLLERTFRSVPEYLEQAREGAEEVNFCNRGVEVTRPFRALKLWMTLKVFGLKQISEAVARGFALARFAEVQIHGMEGWEVVTPAQMGIVTFRFAAQGIDAAEIDRLNTNVVDELMQQGTALVGTTVLGGRTVCRLCTINPRTSEDDIRTVLAAMDRAAQGDLNRRAG